MKPTEFCNCVSCTDCKDYAGCMEYIIETERIRSKLSFGEFTISMSSNTDDFTGWLYEKY